MLLPVDNYYAVKDISSGNPMVVVGETTTRKEAEEIRDGIKDCDCGVYVEAGGKQYRVICKQTLVISGRSK